MLIVLIQCELIEREQERIKVSNPLHLSKLSSSLSLSHSFLPFFLCKIYYKKVFCPLLFFFIFSSFLCVSSCLLSFLSGRVFFFFFFSFFPLFLVLTFNFSSAAKIKTKQRTTIFSLAEKKKLIQQQPNGKSLCTVSKQFLFEQILARQHRLIPRIASWGQIAWLQGSFGLEISHCCQTLLLEEPSEVPNGRLWQKPVFCSKPLLVRSISFHVVCSLGYLVIPFNCNCFPTRPFSPVKKERQELYN